MQNLKHKSNGDSQTMHTHKKQDSYKETLKIIFFCVLFFMYAMLGGVFLILPPLIGVLFIIFMDIYEEKKFGEVVGLVLCLIFFEALNHFPLGILGFVFLFMNYVIKSRFNLLFGYNPLFVFWYVGSVYLVYFLVLYVIKIFGSGSMFSLEFIFIYYFFAESLLGLAYEKTKVKSRG